MCIYIYIYFSYNQIIYIILYYIYIYMYIYICIHIQRETRLYDTISLSLSLYIYICMHIYIYIYIYIIIQQGRGIGKSELKGPRETGHVGSQQNISKNRCAWRKRLLIVSGGTHSVPCCMCARTVRPKRKQTSEWNLTGPPVAYRRTMSRCMVTRRSLL